MLSAKVFADYNREQACARGQVIDACLLGKHRDAYRHVSRNYNQTAVSPSQVSWTPGNGDASFSRSSSAFCSCCFVIPGQESLESESRFSTTDEGAIENRVMEFGRRRLRFLARSCIVGRYGFVASGARTFSAFFFASASLARLISKYCGSDKEGTACRVCCDEDIVFLCVTHSIR